MFNVGPAELIVILLVALLIVGPKRLPEVGKSVGKALRELRRQTDEVRSSFEATINPDLDEIHDETGAEYTEPVEEWDDETGRPPSAGEDATTDVPSAAEDGSTEAVAGPRDPDPGTAGAS
jgi:sec-independent protein translocase protein TatB